MASEDYKRRFTASTNFKPGTLGEALTVSLSNIPPAESTKGSNYTLAATDHLREVIATGAITVTVPAHGVLGAGFQAWVVADGAAVTLDGPGGSNLSLSDGDVAQIRVLNNKVRAWKVASTNLS